MFISTAVSSDGWHEQDGHLTMKTPRLCGSVLLKQQATRALYNISHALANIQKFDIHLSFLDQKG